MLIRVITCLSFDGLLCVIRMADAHLAFLGSVDVHSSFQTFCPFLLSHLLQPHELTMCPWHDRPRPQHALI